MYYYCNNGREVKPLKRPYYDEPQELENNRIYPLVAFLLIFLLLGGIAYRYFFMDSSDPVAVVIDPGHGGSDVGAVFEGRYEKDDNLRLALAVENSLEKRGISVKMTRDDDTFISLDDRCSAAEKCEAELFVSLHRNSADSAGGVEIWINSDSETEDKALAESILKCIEQVGITENRGVKSGYARGSGDYFVNKHTSMPSCLVEFGFINNTEDNRLLDEKLDEYADAIAEAIISNLSVEETASGK